MVLTRDIAYHQVGRVPSVRRSHTDSDSLELIQIVSGDGGALIGERTYPLSPGILLCINAATVHALNPQDENRYCRNKLIVTHSTVEAALSAVGAQSLLDVFERGGACFTLPPTMAGEVDTLFRRMAQAADDNAVIFAGFVRLLTALSDGERLHAQAADARVVRVLHILHTRYAESLTIDRLAEEVHISKYYLCRLFREHTGMSIVQYLNEQRMTTARQLLSCTKQPITAIAEASGFGSPSHFCAVFREHEGITPRDYRSIHA